MLQLVRDEMRGRRIQAAFPPLHAQQLPTQLQWHH
ncbi:hypothetical protein P353_18605 [Comamonas testosteroni]|uniref:Uncharacterized protein n=1 Tax=Comamonas testosteroni TaxID=285 RepID=A0A096FC04_COMTE|nr:hypothetical protein P353_18605 [Comamonas testosteroni]